MRIIAIANQKGGVGKTTTAVNLSACLVEQGKRVLLIDLDPQANCTLGLGVPIEAGKSIYMPLIGEGSVFDHIVPANYSKGDNVLQMIPSEHDLAGAEVELVQSGNHMQRLREILEPLREKDDYDYVFIDCPPTLGVLMISAMGAADEVLLPLQCEYFGIQGLATLVNTTLPEIQNSGINPGIHIEGIVFTMFNRTRHAREVIDNVKEALEECVYDSVIPRTIRLSEAPSYEVPIISYEKNGQGAKAYRALALEFIERHEHAAVGA